MSYIIGIDRKYERLELPSDDFLLCDLDQDSIMCSSTPMQLPPVIRQKLAHLLSLSARLHLSRGVPIGPPAYIQECYPRNCFTADRSVLSSKRKPAAYGRYVGVKSLSFGDGDIDGAAESPVFNAFEFSSRQEDRDYRDFLHNVQGNGTVKSISSISSFDPSKYSTISPSRPSFSSSSTLRDITASLRGPSNRASGMWGSFGRSSEKSVYLCLYTVLMIDLWDFDAYYEFGVLFTEGVFGYIVCERLCRLDFTILDRGFEYSQL